MLGVAYCHENRAVAIANSGITGIEIVPVQVLGIVNQDVGPMNEMADGSVKTIGTFNISGIHHPPSAMGKLVDDYSQPGMRNRACMGDHNAGIQLNGVQFRVKRQRLEIEAGLDAIQGDR